MTKKEFVCLIKKLNKATGKITLITLSLVSLLFSTTFLAYTFYFSFSVNADTADTSVTVLNTAPVWPNDVNDAREVPASAGTSPTNSGSNVVWNTTATDSNGQNYYLLLCKNSAAPTANNGGAAPACNGGASNQWAVSASTASGSQATATYTTSESDSAQSNDWWAWICDSPSADAKCNATSKQGNGAGDGTDNDSPFVINFIPTFTAFADDSPVNPGATVTWTTTAADSAKNADFTYNVKAYICKANDFTGSVCGAGGEWCNSGAFVLNNPTCNAAMDDPMTDGAHNAYGFVIDDKTHAASGGSQGTDSVININNVAPVVGAGSISLLDTDSVGPLSLTVTGGETAGFQVKFTVTDQNSCQNQAAGNEIASSIIDVYRSGVLQANCNLAGDYNDESCYPAAVGVGTWGYSCTQDGGTCSGTSDNSVGWTCTFPLWFNADATDGASGTDTEFWNQNWLASVQADDDNALNSGSVEGSTSEELSTFMAYGVPEATINYGSLEAGQDTGATNQTTGMRAVGNTGLDEELSGTEMCTTFAPGSPPNYGCSQAVIDTIFSNDQKYGTATFTYSSGGTVMPESPADTVLINVPKTRDNGTVQTLNTFWGIQIPGAITLAGDYSGRNTVTGIKSDAANW